MSGKMKVLFATIAVCLLFAPAPRLAAAPASAVKVFGRVMIGEKVTMLTLDVQRDGLPLSELRVAVAGRPAQEQGAGQYRLLLHEPLAAPGKALQVTIEPPPVSPQPFATISAAASVAPWIRITGPADEAHADSGAAEVVIAWSGGRAPYHLMARPEDHPGETAFEEWGILAERKAVPMSHFRKGKRYLLNVDFEARDFVFSGPVARVSRLALTERNLPLHLNVDWEQGIGTVPGSIVLATDTTIFHIPLFSLRWRLLIIDTKE